MEQGKGVEAKEDDDKSHFLGFNFFHQDIFIIVLKPTIYFRIIEFKTKKLWSVFLRSLPLFV
jgi:hypothetical protein